MNSLSWERGGQPSSYHSSNGKDRASKHEQILAFGYSCKLFDDENSARFLDQGKNLVPSSGDNDLLIDRFDVRGYLNAVELEKYAAKFDFDYKSQLTSDEVELERELDKERYRDLYEQPDHDEELRRLKESIEEDDKKHNQIQFDYKQLEPRKIEEANSNSADGQESDEPFAVPEGLVLPDHLQLPTTTKEHNLIEKTARFINKQGAQMEILLKAKQSCNSQFDFLSYDSPLNPYYKHLVQLLKEGTYGDQEDAGQQSDESTEDEGYLHPSLRGSSRPAQPTYKSSSSSYHSYHSFAYPPSNPPTASNPTKTTNSLYSKLAENLKDKIVVNDKSFYKPKIIESKGVRYDLSKGDSTSQDGQCTVEPKQTKGDRPEKSTKPIKNSSIQTKGTKSVFDLTPEIPADIKLIIEKLAQYVCKNGDEFEKTIKARNESRFEFLNSGHKFHFYYVKTKLHLLEEKRKREAESSRKNGSSVRPATKPTSSSSLPSESSNSTNDYVGGKTVQPFVISKKSTSFKEDLEAKLLREKQEERKRKAAEFLNKLKLQKSDEKSLEPKVEEQPSIIGPQLPADRRREDLRNTPSPLREFYDDLDIRMDQQRKQHVLDEIQSIKEKLSQDEEANRSPEQTAFKRAAPKSKQYRVRQRSSSGSERSAADSADRNRRSQSRPNYDDYQPPTARSRTSRTTSRTPSGIRSRTRSRTPSRIRSRTPSRIRSRTPSRIRSRTPRKTRSESRSPSPRRRSRSKSKHRRSRSKSKHRRSRSKSKHRRSRSKSKHRSSRHRSRHSSSRSRSPKKRRKSHRSKKRKRSKERSRRSKERSRRSRDRRAIKLREKSEALSSDRSRDRSSDRSRDPSKKRSRNRSSDRSKDRSKDRSSD